MDKVQRKGDFKVSGMRGRVEWGCSDNQCHRLCFQRKQLWLPGFCWDFSWTGSQLGLVLSQQVKGCEQPGKRAPKKQQEWLNMRQGMRKGWENGVKAMGTTIPVGSPSAGDAAWFCTWMAPRAASAKCKHIP